MKKRIFILAMAILSTSAFATTEFTQDAVTHSITLAGKAFTPITISGGESGVDFGNVVIGKKVEKIVTLTIEGEIAGKVSLTTTLGGNANGIVTPKVVESVTL
ncbi:MAG: hypothetical protein ACRC0V_11175, partial [Fusobacteriaceae bacterium]